MEAYQPKCTYKDVLSSKITQPLISNGIRVDGRPPEQLRLINMKTRMVSRATGSAYLEVGATKVICSIYGPRQSKKQEYNDVGQLMCDFKFAPFSQQVKRGRGLDIDEQEYAMIITESLAGNLMLDKFPKSVIDCNILVLEDDGAALSAGISCASLALADAGVEMFDIVPACSVIYSEDQKILLDPTESEMNHLQCICSLIVSYSPTLKQLRHLTQTGRCSDEALQEMIQLAIDGCSQIQLLQKQTLLAKAAKNN